MFTKKTVSAKQPRIKDRRRTPHASLGAGPGPCVFTWAIVLGMGPPRRLQCRRHNDLQPCMHFSMPQWLSVAMLAKPRLRPAHTLA